MSTIHNVFVFGTLKRRQPNFHVLDDPKNGNAVFISEGTTQERFPVVITSKCNIPFMLPVPGVGKFNKNRVQTLGVDRDERECKDQQPCVREWGENLLIQFTNGSILSGPFQEFSVNVVGEIYEVDDKMLNRLDILERRPHILDRREINIISNGVVFKCWCYHLAYHREELLKLPMINNYDTNGTHGLPYVRNSLEVCDDFSDVQCK